MDFLDWLKMVFALIATLSLIGLAAYGARRFNLIQAGFGAPQRRMKVRESLMLDARRRLVLVQCDAREHLLLLSPSGDQIVAAFDARPEPVQPAVQPQAAAEPNP